MKTLLTWIKPSLGLLALVTAIAGCATDPLGPATRRPVARAPVVDRSARRPPRYPVRRPAPPVEVGQAPAEDPLLPREYASTYPSSDPYADPNGYGAPARTDANRLDDGYGQPAYPPSEAVSRPAGVPNERQPVYRPSEAVSRPSNVGRDRQPAYPPGAATPYPPSAASLAETEGYDAAPGSMPEPQPVVPRAPRAAPPPAPAPTPPPEEPVAPAAGASEVALAPPAPVAPDPTPAPVRPPESVPARPATPPADLPPAEITREGNQAVAALLDSADRYVKSKQLDKAGAALERALRIEPRNAGIWHDLAQIRLHQGQYQQAESLASKSNNLASDNRALQARNWKLIAVARRATGNSLGVDEAEARASQLSR